MWYLCQRVTGSDWEGAAKGRCLHLQVSKGWHTTFEDPLVVGQEWKCACQALYKTAGGTLIEMQIPGVGRCYCKAPIPTQHVEYARAMFYEETVKPLTAAELYDRVPTVKPTLGDIVNESTRYPGWFHIKADDLDKLPEFNWNRIFIIFGAELPAEPPSKRAQKKARQEANASWWAEQAQKKSTASSSQ